MVEIEFLIIANHAEVQNGLLYLNGGGWTQHHRPIGPGGEVPVSSFGVAVGVLVPWGDTNMANQLSLKIEDVDGHALGQMGAELTTGRPPDLAPGSDQRAVMATMFSVQFPKPGEYRIVASIGDARPRMVVFRVNDHPVGAPS